VCFGRDNAAAVRPRKRYLRAFVLDLIDAGTITFTSAAGVANSEPSRRRSDSKRTVVTAVHTLCVHLEKERKNYPDFSCYYFERVRVRLFRSRKTNETRFIRNCSTSKCKIENFSYFFFVASRLATVLYSAPYPRAVAYL